MAEDRAAAYALRVAALFVDPKGVYAGLPDVDVWDEARDARGHHQLVERLAAQVVPG